MSLLKVILKDNNFLSLAGNSTFALLGFASIMLLARSFSPENYGIWVLYISSATFLEMLRGGVLTMALVRFTSGGTRKMQERYIGSSWVIGISVTVLFAGSVCLIEQLFPTWTKQSGFNLFFKWYPALTIMLLPYNYALWILQARQQFSKILLLKSLNMGFIVSVFAWAFFFTLSLETVVLYHIAVNAATSVLAIILGWSGIVHIPKACKLSMSELFHFGKYSTGTLIGTNLLKSSDTLLIGVLMGPTAAALYSIPLKLTETFEIVLRSAVAVAIPKMSSYSINNNLNKVKQVFNQYTGILTILYIPLIVFCFVFAEELVILLGGEQYASGTAIFRILVVYGLFLPFDRFTGVTLDCINRPKINLIKVMLMTSTNVLGDLAAIYFTGSLSIVALVTICTVLVGSFFGFLFLNRDIHISLTEVIKEGWNHLAQLPIKGLHLLRS